VPWWGERSSFTSITLNANLFEAFLICPTKCHLRSLGERRTENIYANWIRAQNDSYSSEGLKRLVKGMAPDEFLDGPASTKNLKMTKWQLAVNLVARAKNLDSSIQAVEKLPLEGQDQSAQFIPIRFIFTNKLTFHDKLLLVFDVFALSEMLGIEVGLGKIIHGDNQVTLKVKTSQLTREVKKLTEKIATMLSSHSAPDLALNRHCPECEYQDRCRQKAIEKDDLSLLAGMSDKERKKLNSKGIFTITQLSYTFRPRRRSKHQQNKRERYHHSLKALAIRENKVHFIGSLEFKIEGTPVYLDVEGLPDRNSYYLIGVRIGHGESTVQHSLWADTISDEAKIWREFLKVLETVENPVLIHYGSYEKTFLKQMIDRHGSPPDNSVPEKAISSGLNLLSIIFAKVYFPTFSNSLKELAGYLGLNWSDPQASGLRSIVLRYEWENSNIQTMKQNLITYNSEDCLALQNLTETLLRIGDESAFSNDQVCKDAVNCDSIRRQQHFRWSLEEFSVQDFASINQASYWSYQRQRVYVKATSPLQLPKRNRNTSLPFDRDVEVTSAPVVCKTCGHEQFRKAGSWKKVVHDLHFQQRGIVRRSSRLHANQYVCVKCGIKESPAGDVLPNDKYGQGLTAYIIYHLVDAFVPQEAVARILNRMFGFRLQGSGCINPIKAKAANFYRTTYENILQRLTRGQLLHVDETRANIQGRRAYVWTFASLDHVAYVYSETREADLPKQVLADFHGVLVSDFYAAYDAISCPQQKCLVHLLRDLNTDLLNAPFNLELRWVAEGFGSLLRSILLSIDRFGLKKRFLRKHKVQADKFIKKIISSEFQTSPAIKYQNRFAKYRDDLFTFLQYDNVPWNNNNAEHAIKSFAQLRRVLRGNSTERGIRDYLVLLSLSQTCKYMGVDFLNFLLSREKDIFTFAESRRRRKCVARPTTE
jgi:predicted RecB family nuclease